MQHSGASGPLRAARLPGPCKLYRFLHTLVSTGIWLASNSITIIRIFVIIHQMVQNLKSVHSPTHKKAYIYTYIYAPYGQISGRPLALAVSWWALNEEEGLISCHFMWDLWWITWHCYRFSFECFSFPLSVLFNETLYPCIRLLSTATG